MKQSSPLLIQQMELGPMQNYIYFVGDNTSKEIVVVDPAWDVDTIRQKAEDQGLTIKAMLITHGHPDHTNGINNLLGTHDIPVYVSKHEASFYKPIGENIKEVDDHTKVKVGDVEIAFLHTPGHTPGSQCFLVDGNLVAGDTNASRDVFLHDLNTGQTTRVSVDSAGTEGNDDSGFGMISGNGQYIAFESDATNTVNTIKSDHSQLSWQLMYTLRY